MPKIAVTFETVRRIGAGLPGLEEGTMYGTPALKLGKSLVACMAINKSAEPGSLAVRIGFEERAALLEEEPETYYLTDHYISHPAVLVRLSRIQVDELRDLLGAARRFVLAEQSLKKPGTARAGQARTNRK